MTEVITSQREQHDLTSVWVFVTHYGSPEYMEVNITDIGATLAARLDSEECRHLGDLLTQIADRLSLIQTEGE